MKDASQGQRIAKEANGGVKVCSIGGGAPLNAMRAIRVIGKLGNKSSTTSYSEADVKKIVGALNRKSTRYQGRGG